MPDKSQSNNGTAGLWLGAGASLLIIALVFHGPPDPDLSVQMHHVAEGHTRWALVHWTAAVALFLISGSGFLNLIDQNTGGSSTGLRSAWLVLALGALLTVSTAVSEAAVVSAAANAGDMAAFALLVGIFGRHGEWFLRPRTRNVRSLRWLKRAAMPAGCPHGPCRGSAIFGVLSAVGWSLGEHFGIGIGGPIWLISTLLMCVWLAWFGFAALRPARRPNLPTDCVNSNARRRGDLT